MSGRPEKWSAIRAHLESVGFRPSRRLGQNFLLEDNVCEAIVRDAELEPGEVVLEVGVGLGFLTRHLLATGSPVIGVEIDPRLSDFAADRLAGEGSFELLRTDVLAAKNRLSEAVLAAVPKQGRWSLVSNLPYAVGSPAMVLLSRLAVPPRRMTVLVQLEVGDRLCADPGTPEWGALGARLQAVYEARLVRRVAPEAFRPRPKVDSAVMQLDLREGAPDSVELVRFDRLLTALFPQRRKRVRNPLASHLGGREAADRALAQAGLDPEARVAWLTVDDWRRLAAAIDATAPSGVGGVE
ncbi:ribosomal RNA small subunit methyltransferase A [Engelhardtia mirabilis]|uniref:Ribosomal RNA small subunit methyltransferase A n=1 Tax=Engelhardtia mirabilis TaxID=2528011 RepID=A0A518BJ78_9BACT|nr:Ribosomal RNA adenine dimethylase [Planctomycetes bacterium Pla133]QDV01342.1 Ribosomal RNA adenine dimethylase [Planctomycetes bacterium Pla86]